MSDWKEHRPTLLIIDDDRAIRRLLTRIAERSGFDVDSAKDGIQAMEMMEKQNYDIAIVDLMMPRLSGYELIEKISTLTPRPTVLVATALMNGDVAHLDDSMVRKVIKKPFDINAVAAALIETAKEIAERRSSESPPTLIVAQPAGEIQPKIVTTEVKLPDSAAPKPPKKID